MNLPGGKKRPTRRAEKLAAICEPNVCKLWEPLTSYNPKGHHGLYRDSFTFTYRSLSFYKNKPPTIIELIAVHCVILKVFILSITVLIENRYGCYKTESFHRLKIVHKFFCGGGIGKE
jgi:hypothetical protein